MPIRRFGAACLALACALAGPAAAQSDSPALTRDQMRVFLSTAKVVKSRDIGKGVTHPLRLTLTDGPLTHDAAFQSVDERSMFAKLQGAKGPGAEINFVDTYRYNLAAETVATLVGLDGMMPVHVERRWNSRVGSLSWWIDSMMDEGERLRQGLNAPDPQGWNDQMYRMRVFSALVRDTDRNLTNVLITPDWQIRMIDFTRAFRLQAVLPNVKDLPRCDRALFGRLKALDRAALVAAAKGQLTPSEIDALFKRRDLLVAHFERLIAERGEASVLY